MIPHYDIIQGTEAWYNIRLGIPTASEFHQIVTAVKGDLSKSARAYAHQLVAEALLGRPLEKPPVSTYAMERGKALEPAAADQYAFITDYETRPVGFVTTNDGRIGASPDRLVIGHRGAVEIKCALDANHMGMFIDGPDEKYKQQVQGQLAVCEVEWVDLHAYHPELPSRTIRTCRDEPYIAKMEAAMREFLAMRDDMLQRALASGFFTERLAA